jgi:hypothetical protein
MRTLNETSLALAKYDYFVKPEIHMVSANYGFGIKELRARVALGFELINY